MTCTAIGDNRAIDRIPFAATTFMLRRPGLVVSFFDDFQQCSAAFALAPQHLWSSLPAACHAVSAHPLRRRRRASGRVAGSFADRPPEEFVSGGDDPGSERKVAPVDG